MAVLLLTACSEDGSFAELSGDNATQRLTFDVRETDWKGETVSVTTRSGETLDGLRITTKDLSWNFKIAVPDADVAALNASQSAVDPNTRLWTYDAGTTYTSAAAFDGYLKGGVKGTTELTFTQGLRFAAAAGDIKIVDNGANSYIRLKGTVTISGLKAGQTVTVKFASASNVVPRTLTFSNLSAPSGFTPPAISDTEKTGSGKVSANGSVTFVAEEEIDIYSINIQKATDDGFGFYCEDLKFSNTQVTWDSETSSWKIGDGYNTYWERGKTGTLDVYAYAPYLASPELTEENGEPLLTFKAQVYGGTTEHKDKLSGSNVDLLWKKTEYDLRKSDPALLIFQHMLAKLTFGTITNNTGGTLRLNGFTVKGDLNTEAKLNLKTGEWTGHVFSSGATISSPPPFIKVVSSESEKTYPIPSPYIGYSVIPPLPNKQTILPEMQNRSMLLIPNENGEIEVEIEVNSDIANEKFSFPVTLKQGEDKTINITIGESFEVVIDGQ